MTNWHVLYQKIYLLFTENKMESSIFVSVPNKGVWLQFKVDLWFYLSQTVLTLFLWELSNLVPPAILSLFEAEDVNGNRVKEKVSMFSYIFTPPITFSIYSKSLTVNHYPKILFSSLAQPHTHWYSDQHITMLMNI